MPFLMKIDLLRKSLETLQVVYNENGGENDVTEIISTLIADNFHDSAEVYIIIKKWVNLQQDELSNLDVAKLLQFKE